MKRWQFLVLMSVAVFSPRTVRSDEISPAGHKLAKFYDSLGVDKLWLAKRYVKWESGEPLDKKVTDGKPHTHCSAFVAAACKRLDVYILRPPEHSAQFLANAQHDWLAGPGKERGWIPVAGPWNAQKRANAGDLVVAVYKEADPTRHGHIALVRPSAKIASKVAESGPQIIQAGMENHVDASLKEGFKHHPAAWAKREVRFYAHKVVVQ
jgi:hypothetical protein